MEGTTLTSGVDTMSGSGWQVVDDHHLQKVFEFPDFISALQFVNKAGAICEQMNHHADFALSWGKVVIKTWTHSENAITDLDHTLAAAIDELE